MKLPHNAQVAVVNGEKFLLLRNIGQPLDIKLERVAEPDLLLTNFSAGVRHPDPADQRSGSVDELAHGTAIAEWLNNKALKGDLGDIAIAADPRTLGQMRQHYHKETQAKVVGEIDKDLTNLPIPAIEKALTAA